MLWGIYLIYFKNISVCKWLCFVIFICVYGYIVEEIFKFERERVNLILKVNIEFKFIYVCVELYRMMYIYFILICLKGYKLI